MQVLEAPTMQLPVLDGPSDRRQNGFPRVEYSETLKEVVPSGTQKVLILDKKKRGWVQSSARELDI